MKNDPRSCEHNLCNNARRLKKIQDINGIWTRDLAIPVRCSHQLSYEATDVGSWSIICSGFLRNCINCVHTCEDHSSFDFISAILMIYFIYIFHIHLFHGNIWTHNWPALNNSGFIAQLVRASHWYREVTGSNPVEVLNFFSGFWGNCITCVHNSNDHSSFDFISAVFIWFISHKSFTIYYIAATILYRLYEKDVPWMKENARLIVIGLSP